jgi:hypothetical protein
MPSLASLRGSNLTGARAESQLIKLTWNHISRCRVGLRRDLCRLSADPPALAHVVKNCLAKDPHQRRQSPQDLVSELEWVAEAGSQAGVPAPLAARRKHRRVLAWALAATLANGFAFGADRRPPTAPSNLTATAASATQINLTWAAPTDNVGGGVSGGAVPRGRVHELCADCHAGRDDL